MLGPRSAVGGHCAKLKKIEEKKRLERRDRKDLDTNPQLREKYKIQTREKYNILLGKYNDAGIASEKNSGIA